MATTITVTGIVATDPRHIVTSRGVPITSFRLGSAERHFNRSSGAWESSPTSWFSVSAFRQLAANAASSLHKGDHVVVTGRLRVRAWEAEEKSGTDVGIEAEAIGHDLSWGSTVLSRSPVASTTEPAVVAEPALPALAVAGVPGGAEPLVEPPF